jgi:hypothetical protein
MGDGGMELTFDDIANVPVADASSVSDWNTFFDLPTYGNPFTSVVVDGDKVVLIGGSEITIKEGLFAGVVGETENYHLISIVDFGCVEILEDSAFSKQYIMQEVVLPTVHTIGYESLQDLTIATVVSLPLLEQAGDYAMAFCNNIESINMPLLVSAGYGCFADYHICNSVNLPNLVTAGEECFQNMYMISSIELPQLTTIGNSGFVELNNISTLTLPSLSSMGNTTGNNHVFLNTTGQTITLTVPAALMTCNGGNPDGDIQYLQANNTVTIVISDL